MPSVHSDINPCRDFRYTPEAFDMCCARDMRCGARGDLYHIVCEQGEHISNLPQGKYIEFRIAKHIAKNQIARTLVRYNEQENKYLTKNKAVFSNLGKKQLFILHFFS